MYSLVDQLSFGGGDGDYNKSLMSLMGTKTGILSHEGIDSDDNSQFRSKRQP